MIEPGTYTNSSTRDDRPRLCFPEAAPSRAEKALPSNRPSKRPRDSTPTPNHTLPPSPRPSTPLKIAAQRTLPPPLPSPSRYRASQPGEGRGKRRQQRVQSPVCAGLGGVCPRALQTPCADTPRHALVPPRCR
ncbi:hypothetical protein Mapa_004455 [Marchantia paleacea]|nr:hypothetical protein Mapa_004455 [Marchantia paleacea]